MPSSRRHPTAQYCPPVLGRESHRRARWCRQPPRGTRSSFLGTDSARGTHQEVSCGCAGVYTAHAGIELYVEALEAAGALDKLEGFAGLFGADFYGLPRNRERLTRRRVAGRPREVAFGQTAPGPHAGRGWCGGSRERGVPVRRRPCGDAAACRVCLAVDRGSSCDYRVEDSGLPSHRRSGCCPTRWNRWSTWRRRSWR